MGLRDELSVYQCVIPVLDGVKKADNSYPHLGAEYAALETEKAGLTG